MLSKTVWVYNGPGAGTRCALSAHDSLQRAVGAGVQVRVHRRVRAAPAPSVALLPASPSQLQCALQVRFINAEAIQHGEWRQDALLLCMPGGADLPYCRELNGKGNAMIRGVVGRCSSASKQAASIPGSHCNKHLVHTPCCRVRAARRQLPGIVRRRLLRHITSRV
jgi:hypothetical protein